MPLLDLRRQYEQIREEVLAAIERVCDSQHFILGEEVEELEKEIARYTGAAHGIGCSSGTDALWLALMAAGVGPGDAVITSPFSFFSSASAIARCGARPVFVDVDARTLNINPSLVKARLEAGKSDEIRALLPVHLYGQCADMDALLQAVEEFRVPAIEDAAQVIGARWRNRPAGSLGRAAAFSFYPTKNLSAYGDAGMVTTSDADWAEHMRRLRNHGSSQRYRHEEIGWNCRLDAIQAAVLRVKLRHLDNWTEQCRLRAAGYDRFFAQCGVTNGPNAPVRLLEISPHAYHVFHQYVIRAKRRDELRGFLGARNIGTEIYYPVPLHLQPCFAYLGYRAGDFPEAERASREVLALPMFPELTEEEQRWVVESVAGFYAG